MAEQSWALSRPPQRKAANALARSRTDRSRPRVRSIPYTVRASPTRSSALRAAGPDRTPGALRDDAERSTGTKGAAGPKRTADVIGVSDSYAVVTPGMAACPGDADGATAGPEPGRDGLAAGVERGPSDGAGRGLSVAAGRARPDLDVAGRPGDVGFGLTFRGAAGLAGRPERADCGV